MKKMKLKSMLFKNKNKKIQTKEIVSVKHLEVAHRCVTNEYIIFMYNTNKTC